MALPFGVKLKKYNEDNSAVELYSINLEHETIQYWSYKASSLQIGGYGHLIRHDKLQFKPYLRPLSSMTEQELEELNCLCYHHISVQDDMLCGQICYIEITDVQNFLLRYHFDFMGLIPKGLAIEVTEENNPYNITEE